MTQTRYRVLVVDDHPTFIRGLCSELEDAGDVDVVGACENGEDAVALVVRERPDVVLIDLRMPMTADAAPTFCGPEVIRRVLESVPGTRLVVLSMHEEPENVRAALNAGAVGYLLKDKAGVVHAVRAVAAGSTMVLDPRLVKALLEQQALLTDGDLPFCLTKSEYRMLLLMVKGLTNQQIVAESGLAAKTVANRALEIQGKLQVRGRNEAVEKARKHGIGRED